MSPHFPTEKRTCVYTEGGMSCFPPALQGGRWASGLSRPDHRAQALICLVTPELETVLVVTSRTTVSSLPGHALRVTAVCEALGTTYPRANGDGHSRECALDTASRMAVEGLG